MLKVVNEDGGEAAHHATAHLEEGSQGGGAWDGLEYDEACNGGGHKVDYKEDCLREVVYRDGTKLLLIRTISLIIMKNKY